jgi:hypothetical protein
MRWKEKKEVQAPSIKHQASSIKHQASSIKHQAASRDTKASKNKHRKTCCISLSVDLPPAQNGTKRRPTHLGSKNSTTFGSRRDHGRVLERKWYEYTVKQYLSS